MSNNIDYDLDALKNGIGKCEKNIEVFEAAIQNEYKTIRDYTRMIAHLEEKKAIQNDDQIGHND
jgi:hypothetical protein